MSEALPSQAPIGAGPIKLQRDLTERLVISALREAAATEQAETSLAHSEFLAKAGMLLGMSLNTRVTRDAVAAVSLPFLGNWCIVDLIEADGSWSRLPMVHPDPKKQECLRTLGKDWRPEPTDAFGIGAVHDELTPRMITDDVAAALEQTAHSPENLQLLECLDIGTLLTIPMVSNSHLLGAVTFVGDLTCRPYSLDEIRLAQSLANRNAEALEHARIYAEALQAREQAELATLNKLRLLANVSHDLRTPLNAIMGYVELIGEQIHGPVTPQQQQDLVRIRLNQQVLLGLVDELLAFVQAGAPRVNHIIELSADEAVKHAVSLIENSLSRKYIRYEHLAGNSDLRMLGDQERVSQILVNLLANAVKFTARGGSITTCCELLRDRVQLRVTDTGIGIDESKQEQIFEPFVQLDKPSREGGVGLGLAISRDLARSMRGDLSVESTRGVGSSFTLSLPRAPAAA